MKWLHNLSGRQRRESARSIPIHTLFVGKNNSNEIWSAKKRRAGQYRYTKTTLGNKSWRIEFFSSAPALNTLGSLFIPRGTDGEGETERERGNEIEGGRERDLQWP